MTKTKIPKLSKLIRACKFGWVNPDITATLFETPKEVAKEFDVMTIDKWAPSEDIVYQMEKEGYRPANAWELLEYANNGWNGKDFVVALGSVAEVFGGRFVSCLHGDDPGRYLSLLWWGSVWDSDCRFLRVMIHRIKN